MINTTNMCNNRCSYCHAGVSQGKDKMSKEIAVKVLQFIFDSAGEAITIEFQGGECLLNWDVVKLVTEEARKLNKLSKKKLTITMVSNLGLMTEEKLKFLINNDVFICTSLDGPPELHDEHRKKLGGTNTQEDVVQKIKWIKEELKKAKKNPEVGALATISKQSLSQYKEIINTYVDLGIPTIHLRQLNNLGDALNDLPNISYTAEEFLEFWKKSMDYLLELNKHGVRILERGAANLLSKILKNEDSMYVEQMSPTGMGRAALMYNFDGSIYSSDEGRMLKEDIFKIGTVDQSVEEVIGNDENVNTWASSMMELTAYHTAFKPWIGLHPALTYQDQGHMIPNITESFSYKIQVGQLKYLFEKIAEEGNEKEIFIKWINSI